MRVLMTIDAVGGVWRYAVDLARALKDVGIDWVFLGLGPAPSKQQRQEAERIGKLVWHEAPLDWMAGSEDGLSSIADVIMQLAAREGIDLLHLNLPSQAAALDADLPVVAVSHSCVPTWFAAVRGSAPPDGWAWHHAANRRGFDRASVVVAPSRSHAAALERTYGPIADLNVVYNASGQAKRTLEKKQIALAIGRWWDEGKNGAVLDAAAGLTRTPITMIGPDTGPGGENLQIRHAWHLGSLQHRKAMMWLHQASILVSPSIYEPFGLAALEGACRGAALVLSDIDTYRELWDGAALFVPPTDAEAIARAIEQLAADHDQRALLAANALARASEFTSARQAGAMQRLYRHALASDDQLSIAG
ncbi:glycosyltransferase family 4 protein [Roseibium salinum]|uniref:Glycosyltransferase family 4 protein n=2 Tax=Roseibium salinum TaxID=1604349 RepID=A0ABT3QX24_9HYPH|nr:glycosyltransferase family 4 protein [Roseibium sp. DSM 29163]MCX2721450.1 glycosyltransferase family 4 protein [Roseibium sp. DSM 29163]